MGTAICGSSEDHRQSRYIQKYHRWSTMNFFKTVLAALLASFAVAVQAHYLDSCPVKMEPIGCFKDKAADRALPVEFLTARDANTGIYTGYSINWKNWPKYLSTLICDCAKLARSKGYRVMGLQFYGECWGSKMGHLEYAKHGKSESCVHGEANKPWGVCGKNDKACIGETVTNFIYKIAPISCNTSYEPVGCFKDKQDLPRPLPDHILNERDYSHKMWNGKLIDWKNWNKYIPQMICRCAEKAKKLGHTTFSLQFYGECWSGKESEIKYDRDGKSDKCWAEDFKPCPYNSYSCVGRDFTNRVYRLKTGRGEQAEIGDSYWLKGTLID